MATEDGHMTGNRSLVVFTLLFCLAVSFGCVDYGEYNDFYYRLNDQERKEAFMEYPLEERVDIYLAGLNNPQGSGLNFEMASSGAMLVPVLVRRLNETDNSLHKLGIIYLFGNMEAARYYPVAKDESLMKTLQEQAAIIAIQDSQRGEIAIRTLARIQSMHDDTPERIHRRRQMEEIKKARREGREPVAIPRGE